jgi:hypothetical protein
MADFKTNRLCGSAVNSLAFDKNQALAHDLFTPSAIK